MTLLRAAPSDGWVLVPREADGAMIRAGRHAASGGIGTMSAATLNAIYRAMLSAAPERVNGVGWLPIESAPRDGTAVLGCWLLPDRPPLFGVVSWGESTEDGAGSEESWLENNSAVANVTHWQPLPSPPIKARPMTNRDHSPSISQNDGGDAKSQLKPSDVLSRAADLIEPEGAWTQGDFARSKSGLPIGPCEDNAVCWCALGAIGRVSDEVATSVQVMADEYLYLAVGFVPDWNDYPSRTQAEVVTALRKASELAREAGQ